jgi:hypothetical protein
VYLGLFYLCGYAVPVLLQLLVVFSVGFWWLFIFWLVFGFIVLVLCASNIVTMLVGRGEY